MGSWRNHRSGHSLGREAAVRQLGLLLVDDEPNILESLAEIFRRHFEVYVAHTAADALALMREHAPRIVVSDQRMPETTGLDLMREIKELNPDTVRILLTGYSDIQVVIQALNDGLLYKYLTKPWEQSELIRTVLAGAQQYLKDHKERVPNILGC